MIATLHAPVLGAIKLVDHALTRLNRKGAMAVIDVEGPMNRDVFDPGETATEKQPSDTDFDG